MADREKVIEYITDCVNIADRQTNHNWVFVRTEILHDAIALLEAQEPVEPIIDTHWETPSVYDDDVKVTENKCGACGAEIDKWDKYCRVCGSPVKWE